jgi:DNA modification methylase
VTRPRAALVQADARALPLAEGSVQCVVTSPPYWGLRDYGVAGQLGLEPTPEAYVANLVTVFREVRRVLRDDGVVWLNLGDSYAADRSYQVCDNKHVAVGNHMAASVPPGLKPKDLVGTPWMVAFALRDDGWWLRSGVVWHKRNPMPESIDDRPTNSHEFVFLLSKRATYFYDAEAIKEPVTEATLRDRVDTGRFTPDRGFPGAADHGNGRLGSASTRNRRSVWTIATEPYAGAHFATMPEALVEPCILAGTSAKGACPACGAPWARVVARVAGDAEAQERPKRTAGMESRTSTLSLSGNGSVEWATRGSHVTTTGWRPTCACPPAGPVPCRVLDPFAGSGTVPAVAQRLGRIGLGVELKADYLALATARIGRQGQLL